ncbi:hypothetical protein Q4591_14655 [Shewanella sp. 3_MG-2023]|uniref:hypothetical protein n=1 Tax=Shewanella sp. 3_MG-2023 TaxID=3062635 RepID=UPI0026E2FE30|nr:hypothetical protein [Shewanella sp. 3_MG-2023]MDO6776594.1 hypothetical protein [Shewanella sp. 3_MG-2023]
MKPIKRAARKVQLSVKVAEVTLNTEEEAQPIVVVYAQENRLKHKINLYAVYC